MRGRLGGLAGFVLVLLASVTLASAQSTLETFPRDELVLASQDGGRHSFEVEMATSPEQQAQGLMFRRKLAADAGMLFLYQQEGLRTMWMKNTVIPLDMLFIDKRGTILQVVERTVPFSLQTISSDKPALAVLEVNAGTAARLGIKPGDRVFHAAFDDGS